ncbi:MAG TPA: 1,4-alpha-glucan branching protein, partial [Actinomycetota bacterium]|nr:1,4-alpha-glucan branching protein [Actinomycetota bacterium]
MRRLALVLHSHVPYVRRNGVWPAGEDMFHQVASESYLPLLGVLERLADRGMHSALTIGITPVLAHQMQDAHMLRELEAYLARIELRALRQVANYRLIHEREVKDLAAVYARAGRDAAARLARCGDGMARAFAAFARDGLIEILGGPATHPLLPLLSSEITRRLQMTVGAAEHERVFGGRASGAWIPECAVAPGVETCLAAANVAYSVVDPAAAGGAAEPVRAADTEVLLVPRDRVLTDLVWAMDGYPSGEWYRDFGHHDTVGGFKNWRVTAPGATLGDKQPYEPAAARRAATEDARHFVAAVERRFDETGRSDLVVAFDTELFGHWWFEGPVWLEEVLSALAVHPSVVPATLGEIAASHAGAARAAPAASSWGAGSDFRNWQSGRTDTLFERARDAEARAIPLLGRIGPVRDQMVRELLLLQSSDWPYQ